MFKTVFIIDHVRHLKRKNVIYRENLDSLSEIMDIDVIFLDADQLENLKKFQGVWKKSKSMLYIEGPLPHISFQNFLRTENFEMIEITKDYTIWKQKK
jgi:hypothetical protein